MAMKNRVLRGKIENEWIHLLKTYPETFNVDKSTLELLLSDENRLNKSIKRKVSFSNISNELLGLNIRQIETKFWDGKCDLSKLIIKSLVDGIDNKGCWENGYEGFKNSLSNIEKDLLIDLSEFVKELIKRIIVNTQKKEKSLIPMFLNGASSVKVGIEQLCWLRWFNNSLIFLL